MNNTKLIVEKKITPDLITNGNFDIDSDWVLINASISDGTLSKDITTSQALIQQNLNLDLRNKKLKFIFNVDELSGGNVDVKIVGSSVTKHINEAGRFEFNMYNNGSDVVSHIQLSVAPGVDFKISKIQLYEISEIELDTLNTEDIEINLQLLDTKNIFQRQTNYSKNITLPASDVNNKFFNDSYDLSRVGSYELNTGEKCKIFNSTIEIFEGYLELNKIIRNDSNDIVEYSVNIFSQLKHFLGNITNTKLYGNIDKSQDIDLSKYNHTVTKSIIENSWTGNEPYVYVPVERGINDRTIDCKDLILCPKIKPILDTIFTKNGIIYESDFLNSDYFKKLIYLKSEYQTISEEELNKRKVVMTANTASGAGDQHNIFPFKSTADGYFITPMDMDITIEDEYDQVIDNGRIKIHKKGIYNITSYLTILGTMTNTHGNTDLVLKNAKINEYVDAFAIPIQLYLYKNGVLINKNDKAATFNWDFVVGDTLLPSEVRSQKEQLIIKIPEEELCENDVLNWEIRSVSTWNFKHKNNNKIGKVEYDFDYSFKVQVPPLTPVQANTITLTALPISSVQLNDISELNSCLSSEQTQAQFIGDIIKLFNLFIYVDKNKPNILQIEPYNNFWTNSSKVLNWTGKRDLNSKFIIEDVSDLRTKNIQITYQKDSDRYAIEYEKNHNKIYGEFINVVDNQYKDTHKIEVSFAPTIMSNYRGTLNDKKIVPDLVFKDSSGNIQKNSKSKPRILHYNGLKDISSSTDSYKFRVKYNNDITIYNSYPFASTYEDYDFVSGADLNFDTPEQYFHSPYEQNVTGENLVNIYYKQYLEDLMNIDSKKVTAFFNLNDVDINQFSFNNKILIDGIYFRCINIKNYNSNKLTEVTLIKLNSPKLEPIGRVFIPRDKYIYPMSPNIDYDSMNNFDLPSGGFIRGDRNRIIPPTIFDETQIDYQVVAPTGDYTIFGDNNTINNDGDSAFIWGDDLVITEPNSFNIKSEILDIDTKRFKLKFDDKLQYEISPMNIDRDGFINRSKSIEVHIIDDAYDQYNRINDVHIVDVGLNTARGFQSYNTIFIVDDTNK